MRIHSKRCPVCDYEMIANHDDKNLFNCTNNECVVDGWMSRTAISTIRIAVKQEKIKVLKAAHKLVIENTQPMAYLAKQIRDILP